MDRVKTGIVGLDTMLNAVSARSTVRGFWPDRQRQDGSCPFLARGLRLQEPCLLVTLDEPRSSKANMATFGWKWTASRSRCDSGRRAHKRQLP